MTSLALLSVAAVAQTSEPIVVRELLAVRTPGNRRSYLRTDPIEAQIVAGTMAAPTEGAPLGTNTWAKVTAGNDGWFQGPQFAGGYAYATVDSPSDRILLLDAVGHSLAYVNGELRAGDPYQYGYVSLPVRLRAGKNELLFSVGRGRLNVKLSAPRRPVMFDVRDATLPDLTPAVKGPVKAGLIVINSTNQPLTGLRAISQSAGAKPVVTDLPPIGPLTSRKLAITLPGTADKVNVNLMQGAKSLDMANLTLRRRAAGQPYKRTFVSGIDGSVQYYGVNPSTAAGPGQAMFLSLHGASVEAIGQAEAYAPKSWGHLVAPTNRRPFGFDWEDVGRLDGLEVLAHAQSELKTDPRRTYLTGHSMGGHGTWQLGVHFPDRFAAIAPSAGWISFWTYAGGGQFNLERPIEAMLRRASSASDTLALKQNYWQQAVFILHGDADDNVPVTEARTMRQELAGHPALAWHEQPGAGHWWSEGDEPGARCVDWPGIFDTFARRQIPQGRDLRQLRFATANPGVSARNHWVTIEQQAKPWVRSSVSLDADPHLRRIRGNTENVARMTLRLTPLIKGSNVTVALDGGTLTTAWPARGEVHLVKNEGRWAFAGALDLDQKHPGRSGGFKDVFRNRVRFVYGTRGTPEERAWAYAKARYDAETLWYRGNGAVDVIADTDFLKLPADDRNVLLYGNAETNEAWTTLLGQAPVQVTRGKVRVGTTEITGDDLNALFIVPRRGTARASVGVVSGTGIVGLRLNDRAPFFVSGAAIPDLVVASPRMLSEGSAGIRVAGFFGNRWDTEGGDFAWNP